MNAKKKEEKEKPIGVAFTHEIKLKDVEDLLCCAFEGGIGYWCQIYGYKRGKGKQYKARTPEDNNIEWTTPKYLSFPLSPGYAVLLRDTEEHSEKWVLNYKKIVEGLRVMAWKYPKHFANFINDNFDADTGDVFVQCALFGELIYG